MSLWYRNSRIWKIDGATFCFSQSLRYPVKLRMKDSSKPWSSPCGSTQTVKTRSSVEDSCAQNVCLRGW